MRKVTIANLNIEVDFINDDFFLKRLKEYENNLFDHTHMKLITSLKNLITIPKGTITEQIKNATIVRIDKNRYCRYLSDTQTGSVICAFFYDNNYSNVELQFLNNNKVSIEALTMNEYIYTGYAFHNKLVACGGGVIHGSAISYKNQGIIFSANSGTGKSTQTRLWKERFGKEITIVNDDKPAIQFQENNLYMFGTPWSGKTDLNTNMKCPIHAIVFIKQDKVNKIEKLTIRDSTYYLAGQISRPYYDRRIGEMTMEFIEKIVQAIPIYLLSCTVSQEAVTVTYNRLTEEGVLKI